MSRSYTFVVHGHPNVPINPGINLPILHQLAIELSHLVSSYQHRPILGHPGNFLDILCQRRYGLLFVRSADNLLGQGVTNLLHDLVVDGLYQGGVLAHPDGLDSLKLPCVVDLTWTAAVYNLDSFKLTPKPNSFTENQKNGIINIKINDIGEAHIPVAKITKYVLNPEKSQGKDKAFKSALGYDLSNAMKLIENVEQNINKGVITERPQTKYGKPIQIALKLTGANGKTANVITGWIADAETNEVRLTSIYVKSPK